METVNLLETMRPKKVTEVPVGQYVCELESFQKGDFNKCVMSYGEYGLLVVFGVNAETLVRCFQLFPKLVVTIAYDQIKDKNIIANVYPFQEAE